MEYARVETTFWMDFSIADKFGVAAIKDTYRRAFRAWRSNAKYFAELVITLNHKIWQHYEAHNDTLADLYNTLWSEADAWALDNLKGEDLTVYWSITD